MNRDGIEAEAAVRPAWTFLVVAGAARSAGEAAPIAVATVALSSGIAPSLAGLLVATWTLPQVVTGVVVGRWLDRTPAASRLLSLLFVSGASAVALALALMGSVPVGLVVVLVAGFALAEPAATGALSAAAMRDGRYGRRLAGIDGLAYNVAGLSGPAVVAVAALVGGSRTIAAAYGLLVVIGAIGLRTLRLSCAALVPDQRPSIRVALGEIRHGPHLRPTTVLTTVSYAAFGGLGLALVTLVDGRDWPAAIGGALLVVLSIGGVCGSIWCARRPPSRAPLSLARVCVAATGVALVTASVAPLSVVFVCVAIVGFLDGPLMVATFRAREIDASVSCLGSVYAVAASLKMAATSVGAVAVGVAASRRFAGAGLMAMAAIQVLALGAVVATVGRGSDRVRRLDSSIGAPR